MEYSTEFHKNVFVTSEQLQSIFRLTLRAETPEVAKWIQQERLEGEQEMNCRKTRSFSVSSTQSGTQHSPQVESPSQFSPEGFSRYGHQGENLNKEF